ncbi:MAG: hypothetical protein SCH71_05000 [Desulfobulbaceae bacterium]|nr:hypothetical protein [Desulfobulbaceae bacterium]
MTKFKKQKLFPRPKVDGNITYIERQRMAINMSRQIYRRAGYDFDTSVRKVANDLKNNKQNIPNEIKM